MKKFFAQAYIWILLIVLYAPIVIIAIYSFTEAKVLGNWTGFSLNLYKNVFSGGLNNSLIRAIENTLSIGLISAFLSTILGTISAIGIYNLHGRKRKVMSFLNDPDAQSGHHHRYLTLYPLCGTRHQPGLHNGSSRTRFVLHTICDTEHYAEATSDAFKHLRSGS